MKKITFFIFIIMLSGCYNKNTDTKYIQVERNDLILETGEVHEAYYFKTDTTIVTDHCDDCKYCIKRNKNKELLNFYK